MDEKDHRTSLSDRIWLAIIILAAFFAGVVGVYIWKFGIKISTEQEVWGQFGDYLGGVINPAVGFITIILLVITLNTQRQELALQREDLRRSADALDAQYKAIQIQSFEQTLFKWFDNYQKKIREIQYLKDEKPVEGLDAIRHLNKAIFRLTDELRSHFDNDYTSRKKWLELNHGHVEALFDKTTTVLKRNLQAETYTDLSTAIRIIYGLLRWINDHELFKSDKKRKMVYTSIIRAQLSEQELRLLFAFGLTPAGSKFAKYANLASLFDNMRVANSPPIYPLTLVGTQPIFVNSIWRSKVRSQNYRL